MSARHLSSRSIRLGARLLAASSIVGGSLVLQGCDNAPPDSGVYPDSEACVADQVFTRDYCEKNFKKAQEEHSRLAPRYSTKSDCEKDWSDGQCDELPANPQPAHNGNGAAFIMHNSSSSYAPRMNGYWVGSNAVTDSNGNSLRPFTYPTYKASNGTIYSPETNQEFSDYGRKWTKPDIVTANEVSSAPRAFYAPGESISTGAPSRGGFGATGRGFGFGLGE